MAFDKQYTGGSHGPVGSRRRRSDTAKEAPQSTGISGVDAVMRQIVDRLRPLESILDPQSGLISAIIAQEARRAVEDFLKRAEITEHIGGEDVPTVGLDDKVDDGVTYERLRGSETDGDGRVRQVRKSDASALDADDAFDKPNDDLDDISDGTTHGRVLADELDTNRVKQLWRTVAGEALDADDASKKEEVRDNLGGAGVADVRDAGDAILVDTANAEIENILALATVDLVGSPALAVDDARAGAVRALNAFNESTTPVLLTAVTEGVTPANDGVSDTGIDVTDGTPGTMDADSGTGKDGGGGFGGDPAV